MRVMFAGTPAVAVPALRALYSSNHEVRAVLTRPPAPVGRKRVLTPSPVHQEADALGLEVLTGEPNDPCVLEMLDTVDCVAVVAYGALIREPALSRPTHGWVNLHFSLLPAWRGAAPVQYAIMSGERVTGVSVFQIEHGLDTGPVFATKAEPIQPNETAGDLLTRLADIGAPVLVKTLDAIEGGEATATPQTGQVTTAPTLRSSDGRIDWSLPAERIDARIRGLTPAPGAWTRTPDGERFKIGPVRRSSHAAIPPGQLRVTEGTVLVGTGSAPVALDEMAPPGKPWMSSTDWARGLRAEHFTFEETL